MALLIHQTFQARSAAGLKTMARTGILRQYRRDESPRYLPSCRRFRRPGWPACSQDFWSPVSGR